MNKDFIAGWGAAREQWQRTGSVAPNPSNHLIPASKKKKKVSKKKKAAKKTEPSTEETE